MIENHGYKLEHCRKNCKKAAKDWSELNLDLESTLNELELKPTLEEKFDKVHYHHIPKVVIAGCPNGCSQPQIRDIGIVGYLTPKLTDNPCVECLLCVDACLENALAWANNEIVLESSKCVSCGECIRVCPTERIGAAESGWTIHLGGRLGRHPKFAKVVGKEQTEEAVIKKIKEVLIDYIHNGKPEERLSQFLERYTDQ